MNLNHCFEYKEFMTKCHNRGSKKIELLTEVTIQNRIKDLKKFAGSTR